MKPRLRFKEFSNDWVRLNLLSVSSQGKYGMNSAATEFDGVNKYIRITDIDENSRKFSPNPLCSPSDFVSDEYRLIEGDIVFARTGASVGKSYLYDTKDGDLFFAGFLIKFHIENAVPYFVFTTTLLQAFNNFVSTNSMRSGQPGLNAEELGTYTFYAPTLIEQTKIASFLSAVDEKITQLTKKHELLTQYKKGVMQKIFSQELRFKADDGGDYPDWASKKIGEALTIGSGKDYKHLSEGDVPVYGTGGYMLSVNEYLYDGDSVGIGRKGTIDKPIFLKGKFWTVDTLFYTHTFNSCLPKFIFYVFLNIDWKSHNEASGVPSLSKSTIEKLLIPFPSLPEQAKIASFLSAIDDKIQNTRAQLETIKQYKQGLLQQMFI